MGASATLDWYQILAGVFGALGLFFLAIGTFSKEDKKDARWIAPILSAVGMGAGFGGVTYYVLANQAIWHLPVHVDASPVDYGKVVGIIFLVAGYVGGLMSFGDPLPASVYTDDSAMDRFTKVLMKIYAALFRRLARAYLLFGVMLLVLTAIMAIVAVLGGPSTASFGPGAAITGLLTLGSLSFPAAVYFPPTALKALGLLCALVSIGLAVAPAVADLSGSAIK